MYDLRLTCRRATASAKVPYQTKADQAQRHNEQAEHSLSHVVQAMSGTCD
jgi:hypothetical protein